MSSNPLFPQTDKSDNTSSSDAAVELIRAKVSRAYADEPDAAVELAEASVARLPSKHQLYMQELSNSGKSLAEIQTAWHHYYTTLTDAEKHEVWQEFYAANQNTPYQKLFQKQQEATKPEQPHVIATAAQPLASPQPAPSASGVVVGSYEPLKQSGKSLVDKAAARDIKSKITHKVSAGGKLTAKHHLQSLGFGLASGFLVLLVFLFTFFNDAIIAPFIQPSRKVSSTPIIWSNTAVAADIPPSVTVPKINIQIPVNFTATSVNEAVIQDGLKSGVVHYPSTVLPGQNGNGAYFGHSSGNIFNNGKYKFAFTLLHDLNTGDLFYINYSGKTYAYRIFDRQVVPPTAVGVIHDTRGKQATATLITCDPPGLSTNRLVLWGEQISPNPAGNTAAPEQTATTTAPEELTGNGPSLWSQFVDKIEFWN